MFLYEEDGIVYFLYCNSNHSRYCIITPVNRSLRCTSSWHQGMCSADVRMKTVYTLAQRQGKTIGTHLSANAGVGILVYDARLKDLGYLLPALHA